MLNSGGSPEHQDVGLLRRLDLQCIFYYITDVHMYVVYKTIIVGKLNSHNSNA